MQPIVYEGIHHEGRIIVRSCSNNLTIINRKNFKIMSSANFADHETALFYAQKLTTN